MGFEISCHPELVVIKLLNYSGCCFSNLLLWTLDISRYIITQFGLHHNNFEGNTSVRLRTHERRPYLALNGRGMGVFRELFGEKWPRDIGSALYHSDTRLCLEEMDLCRGITWMMQKSDFVDAPSQWETTLQCNVASHWLSTYMHKMISAR